MIDQFIASGERKWRRASGLVMLLPHGYEGQGPEHSSARLERFLQLCSNDNMQVMNCTTPANYFHALRRQMHRDFRKPLIMMTPKSLLRNKYCVSNLEDFSKSNSFHRILWDHAIDPQTKGFIKLKESSKIKKVIMCSGKVYFDLLEAREKLKKDDVILYRIEQLYPFPAKTLVKELKPYAKNANFSGVRKSLKIWVLGFLLEIISNGHWILLRLIIMQNFLYRKKPRRISSNRICKKAYFSTTRNN